MPSREETRAPLVDTLELLGLFILPALLVGVVLSVVSGTENLIGGIVIGGLFGAILAGLRRGFYAFRREEGIERRLRSPLEDSDNMWARLANIEYDPKYDRLLALLLFVVGVGSFAAIPFVDPQNGPLILQLVLVGLFGITAGLVTYGVAYLTSQRRDPNPQLTERLVEHPEHEGRCVPPVSSRVTDLSSPPIRPRIRPRQRRN